MAFGPHWQHAWLVIASFLAGALNAMAGGGSFLVVSGAAWRGGSAYPGKCNQYSCPLAGPVHLDRRVLARSEGQSAAGAPGLFRGLAGRSAGSHRPAPYRPGHLHGAGALAVAARRRALCRQRSGLRLAAARSRELYRRQAPAWSRYGSVWWWCAFTSGISAPARAFC